jgi:hypothetical protein
MPHFVLGMSEREVVIFLDAVVAMAEPVKTHLPMCPGRTILSCGGGGGIESSVGEWSVKGW